ncbi:MAG: arginase family protein, partial [Synechococcus sp.]
VNQVGNYDVAIVGVPHDCGTTYRPGTRFGPQGIRRISALYTPYNYEMGVDLREQITLCDVGDIFTIPANIGTIYFNILMVMDAVKFVPKELIETTLTLGGRSRQVLVQVVARYSLPSTLRINIATSWNLVVVAELVAAEVGLGKRIQLAQRFFRTDQIFAELIVLGLIGFAIDMGFRLLLRLSCKWAV